MKITLDQFITKYLGEQVEYHSYDPRAKYQCVDLVNQYIVEVLGLTPIIGTDAKDFHLRFNKNEFDWIPNTEEAIIETGDIPTWNKYVGGGAGHVAIAIKKGTLTQFSSLDQNWSKPLFVTKETHNYTNVLGWMRKKGTMATISVDTAIYEMLVTKASKLDEIEKTGYVTKPEHDKKVSEMDSAIAVLQKRISDHKCPTAQTVDMSKWELNGLQVTEGNKIFNYKLK